MLEYEVTARMKQVVGEYLVRYPGQAVYGVGRVRKDEVEFFSAYFQEVEDIVMHHGHIVEAEVPGLGTDERSVCRSHLHAVNPRGAARGELEGNGACAAEQVEDLEIPELIFVVQYVEEPLLCEIRGRTGLVTLGREELPAPEPASAYPHLANVISMITEETRPI